MGFGNFKVSLWALLIMICVHYGSSKAAQIEKKSATLLYQSLDKFLANPNPDALSNLTSFTYDLQKQLNTKDDHLAWVITLCNLAYYHNQYQHKNTAISLYETAWAAFNSHQLTNYDLIANCLQPLGNLYIQTGDLPKAETTILSYLHSAQEKQNNSAIIAGITNLSIVYHQKKQYEKAIRIIQEGLKIAPNNTSLLINLASNELSLKNYSNAKNIAEKVIELDASKVKAYTIMAAVYLSQDVHDKAIEYLKKAKAKMLNTTFLPRELAMIELEFVDILLQKNDYALANSRLKEVYSILLGTYDYNQNLPDDDVLLADRVLLNALDAQGAIYTALRQNNAALLAYEKAFKVHDLINQHYLLQDSQLLSHGQNRIRTENYIAIAYELYQSTSDKKYIDKAFWAVERTKSPIVTKSLYDKKRLLQIENDSLVIRYKTLQNSLAVLSVKLFKEKSKGNAARVAIIQNLLDERQKTSIALKKTYALLEQKYPELNAKQPIATVEEIQQEVQKLQTTLLEYFYGTSHIYLFTISSNNIIFEKVAEVTAAELIIKSYISFFNTTDRINNDISAFTKAAYELYTVLNLPKQTEKLLIIPDDILYFVPFEALLTQKTNTLQYSKMPFLLRSTMLSYEISASKYVDQRKGVLQKPSVLGVFPVFKGSSNELSYSELEQKAIQQQLDGMFLNQKEATFSTFKEHANTYTILHLSTHATAGSYQEPANISFFDQDIPIDRLYGMNLRANLVVLSACETGIGKRVKGEGPLSVGRAFQYAGIENVLFSLWKVNDESTYTLMDYFYEHFTDHGKPDLALHQAKLDYINDSTILNQKKSPYHWASFVYYGKQQKIIETTNFLHYIFITLLLLIILGIISKLRT
ncbi:CHAT domain-containing protein [Aquimarina brevivitae]|uniref:CHAT domain-containing protein n=1 Tax=Aquimarina brevivitae TaxID=323412 RepID=A0A4Q7PGC8_9FLAO|nr:CHAT domain-containing protein [Aquimarina brevivitae]RZS98938.1 CHAT domain-containing protein [Aquimarina brevivitae]